MASNGGEQGATPQRLPSHPLTQQKIGSHVNLRVIYCSQIVLAIREPNFHSETLVLCKLWASGQSRQFLSGELAKLMLEYRSHSNDLPSSNPDGSKSLESQIDFNRNPEGQSQKMTHTTKTVNNQEPRRYQP